MHMCVIYYVRHVSVVYMACGENTSTVFLEPLVEFSRKLAAATVYLYTVISCKYSTPLYSCPLYLCVMYADVNCRRVISVVNNLWK